MTRSLRRLTGSSVCLLLLGVAGCGGGPAEQPPPPTATAAPVVAWHSDLDQALGAAAAEDRLVVVDLQAEWCVWCTVMRTTSLRDPRVAGLIDARAVPVRLEVEGPGQELATRHGITSLPALLTLRPDGSEVGRVVGYRGPEALLRALEPLLTRGPTGPSPRPQ